MTTADRWALYSIKRFHIERDRHGDVPWPGYWSMCILNWTDHLKIVWC